ncbi:hypothetical protein ACHAW5_008285 [Stephanodiscus triporus]|uniref:PH domain-containing protein n=1 Tax=Stephanodiscus triporus TaxID=2934178 RepID=A0ABD3QW50_9STRA
MATTAAANAGATALGLSLNQESVDITKEIFLLQMQQTKRLFTAQWAESSYRYGEAMAQAAEQHLEDMALAKTAYLQAEKINSQQMKLARDQDSRAFEMSIRTEARESLRDDLSNQFNRYNIVMLCDTVCLSLVYGFVVEGIPPEDTGEWILIPYLFFMGGSIMCFSVSLWFCVTIVRRLHEHSAAILERKLFLDDEELQDAWQEELVNGLPTGPNVIHHVNRAYSRWLSRFITPMGNFSTNTMIIGVIMMFICGGLLTHVRYTINYNSVAGVTIFWVAVFIATFTIILSKIYEDACERKKDGVYDNSYLDKPSARGPMAKVKLAEDELFTTHAARLGSSKREALYREREHSEREFVPDNSMLYEKAEALRKIRELRAKQRKDVLETLTAAGEEINILPADLMERVNKIIYDVDEADRQTARYVSMPSKKVQQRSQFLNRDANSVAKKLPPMLDRPIDAQHTSVSLTSLRKKLGEIPLTTIIRIRNLANEPLRLKSGAQLIAGQYVKDVEVAMISSNYSVRHIVGQSAIYHLFPISEIPARTEVVIAARSLGNKWFPTSGIDGELVFVNKSGTWIFRINFSNGGFGFTTCKTTSMRYDDPIQRSDVQVERGEDKDSVWRISHETIDQKRNSEVLVQVEAIRPPVNGNLNELSAVQGGLNHYEMELGAIVDQERELQQHMVNVQKSMCSCETEHSNSVGAALMKGVLFEEVFALDPRFMWQQRWCELSSSAFTVCQGAGATPDTNVPLDQITKVLAIPDMAASFVFHIYSHGRKPIKLKAQSAFDREQWIGRISDATGQLYIADWGNIRHGESTAPGPQHQQPRKINFDISAVPLRPRS